MGNRISERRMELSEALEDVMEGLVSERVGKWKLGCESDRKGIRETMVKLASGGKEGFITFSYIRGSYLDRKYDFYMAYCDTDFPEQTKGAGQETIQVSGFMDKIDDDVDVLEKEAGECFEQVTEGDREYLYDWYMEAVYEKLADMVEEIAGSIERKDGTEVYYGEHLGEQMLMGHI